jgi:hypothetical protein
MISTFKEERSSIPGKNISSRTLLNKRMGKDTKIIEQMKVDENASIQIGNSRRHKKRNSNIPR